jgi:putative two-component system response regulator
MFPVLPPIEPLKWLSLMPASERYNAALSDVPQTVTPQAVAGGGSLRFGPQRPPQGLDLGGAQPASEHAASATTSPAAPKILLVDGNPINRRLLKSMLRMGNYAFLEAETGLQALAIIGSHNVDLIILDLLLPGLGGTELCRRMKGDRKTQFIPILMVTSVSGHDFEVEGIEAGADEYLKMPLHPSVVRARVNSLLRHKAAVDSLEEAETILFALAQAVENRDMGTGQHCERLAIYSVALGLALGLPRQDLVALYRGGFLHDIGKIAVPDAILLGTGKLTEEQWRIMQRHTIHGVEICRPMKTLASVLPIIRSHHERWDGTGYPDGLRGEEIPLLARILQVVDIFDALTTARSYKPAYSKDEALEILKMEAAKGWRDTELVALFVSMQSGAFLDSRALIESAWPELNSTLQSLQNMNRHLRGQD